MKHRDPTFGTPKDEQGHLGPKASSPEKWTVDGPQQGQLFGEWPVDGLVRVVEQRLSAAVAVGTD